MQAEVSKSLNVTIASKFGVVGHEKETKAVNQLQKTVCILIFYIEVAQIGPLFFLIFCNAIVPFSPQIFYTPNGITMLKHSTVY